MGILYDNIALLCAEKGIKAGRLCADLGLSRGLMTDLKMGRKKSVSAETADKIASYLGVSVGRLLGTEQQKKPLINDDEELTEYLDELRSRPEKRMLFSVTKNATKAQIEAIVKMIEEMKGD